MEFSNRIKIAIQKSGRLAEKSLSLLAKCGLDFDLRENRLITCCREFPIDLMLVRDDDIPEYVADGVCQLGIVGQNVIEEASIDRKSPAIETLVRLGFGNCRLCIALPEKHAFSDLSQLNGLRIATSYPTSLKRFLSSRGIRAQLVELSGSVEIAPSLNIADAICDIVSTGASLKTNRLKEVVTLLESEAVIIRTNKAISENHRQDIDRLVRRVNSVIRASESKYIMMNAPKSALPDIQRILPGMEEPSIMPLGLSSDRIAIHAVAKEPLFWETIETLKAAGASSILVLPIEKVVP